MTVTLRALLLAAASTLAYPAFAAEEPVAAEKSAEKPAEVSVKDYTILKIGSEEIKNSEVIEIWNGLFPNTTAPDFNSFDENVRQNVLRGLLSERLIYNEAAKAGIDKDPEVQRRLDSVRKQVVIQAFMEGKAKSMVTDEQLRAVYAEKAAAAKGQEELKARHILVSTEEEAKKIIDQVKKGGDFEKIAQEKSTDKASGMNGGDLGWFTKDRMVAEFADAAFKLKKGEVGGPIKTQFGWHVIKLEDRRPLQIASFDEMKDSINKELAGRAAQTYVEGLLKTAGVKYYGPDGKEKSFSVSLTPPTKEQPKAK